MITCPANRVAIVTGATGAIGRAIARRIAGTSGYTVVLIGRDSEKTAQTAEELRRETGNPRIHHELADLSRGGDITAMAMRWQGPLHVLVNNAAETPRQRQETPEGIERQFATNVLGYFRMTREFLPLLQECAPARVVNVASYWAGGLDLTDLEFRLRSYDNDTAYRQSKQANRMLASAFAGHPDANGVSVNACHPGDVNSKLSRNLGFGGHESPDQGAANPVWLATDPVVEGITGKYFEHKTETTCRFSQDWDTVKALYEACLTY